MECELPTINESDENIEKILKNSNNIAVIGLSPNPTKASHMVAKYMIEQGYTIYPIYPKEDEILGCRVYRSLDEIDGVIDIVDVFRKPEAIPALIDDIEKRGSIKSLWLQLGISNDSAAKKAKELGLEVVQNRCLKIEYARMKHR